jgi:hypothetical protein
VVLFTVGGVALLVGWVGASGTVFPAEQIPYLASGAAGGLFLLGLGATFWLSADLRDEWHKLDRLERRLFAEAAPANASLSLESESVNGGAPDFSISLQGVEA